MLVVATIRATCRHNGRILGRRYVVEPISVLKNQILGQCLYCKRHVR